MPITIHKLAPGILGDTHLEGDTLIVEIQLLKYATGRDIETWLDSLPQRARLLRVSNALLISWLRKRGFVEAGGDWERL